MLYCEETICDMHSFTHYLHLILHVIYYIWLVEVFLRCICALREIKIAVQSPVESLFN